jgi:hypothetical protein
MVPMLEEVAGPRWGGGAHGNDGNRRGEGKKERCGRGETLPSPGGAMGVERWWHVWRRKKVRRRKNRCSASVKHTSVE